MLEFYATTKLGAIGSELSALSWFFDKPYETIVATLSKADEIAVQRLAANCLLALGRFAEALPLHEARLTRLQVAHNLDYSGFGTIRRVAQSLFDLARTELLVGRIAEAIVTADRSRDIVERFAHRATFKLLVASSRATRAEVLYAAGQGSAAERAYIDREQWLNERNPKYLSYTMPTFLDLLLAKGAYRAVRERASEALSRAQREKTLLYIGLNASILGRALLGLAHEQATSNEIPAKEYEQINGLSIVFDDAVDHLHTAENAAQIPRGLLARTTYRRSIGDWDGAARDLDEVEEIAEPGPMKLYLCDMALERARLVFAKIEAFAPLNGNIDESPLKPVVPDAAEAVRLKEEARANLAAAGKLIADCGYHRRDEELAELEAVLRGERKFADLPPRV
jgi:hypothetical protein